MNLSLRKKGLKSWLFVSVLAVSVGATGSDVDWHMESMDPDLQNLPSLQNGMRLYQNYCIGCHSLQFQRYERTADDLGIPHEIALESLIFSGQKVGGLMQVSMNPESAKNWFGGPPPDLTMVAKVRGVEWIYNYLKTFYLDPSRPFGVNNKVFPNVGMPHVLQELQGVQKEGCVQRPMIASNGGEARDPLVPGQAITAEKCGELYIEEGTGILGELEYDAAAYDLVNYLYYVAEPSRLERHRTGIFVLLFLVILYVLTYLLNREYWKDVH